MKPASPEQAVFAEALQCATPEARVAYLDAACGTDTTLRRRVEVLLRAAENAGDFLEQPPTRLSGDTDSTQLVSELSEKPGDRIGRYKLLEKIGEGGCGVVYMAEQEEPVRRRVALKVIKLGMDTRSVIARFEAERQALALMDHPNIAKVLDGGATHTGRPYFVMELVRGVRITEFCDEARLTTEARLRLFVQVCQAIQHAHQKGIIHRDLKPSNILVTVNDGAPVPKVIDFGIAKATGQRLTDKTLFTQFHSFIGTPAYTSPEQAEMSSVDIDTRSDIYSLGVLLYELLTGQTPFDGEQMLRAGLDEMRRIIREVEPVKPSTRLTQERLARRSVSSGKSEISNPKSEIDKDLDLIVMKCLAKARNERYESAANLAADSDRWLHGEPLVARAPSLGYVTRLWLKRNFGSTGWAITLGLVWGIVFGVVCWVVVFNPLDLPYALRRAICMGMLGLFCSGGLIVACLVRPKNKAADLVAGTISGTLAAVVAYTISWGWVVVSIVGVPYGIWLGQACALVYMGGVCVIGTSVAGTLLRRHGRLRSVILPYAELAIPTILAVISANALLFQLAIGNAPQWRFLVALAFLLTIASVGVLRRWHWLWRALLHVAWVATFFAFEVMRHRVLSNFSIH